HLIALYRQVLEARGTTGGKIAGDGLRPAIAHDRAVAGALDDVVGNDGRARPLDHGDGDAGACLADHVPACHDVAHEGAPADADAGERCRLDDIADDGTVRLHADAPAEAVRAGVIGAGRREVAHEIAAAGAQPAALVE